MRGLLSPQGERSWEKWLNSSLEILLELFDRNLRSQYLRNLSPNFIKYLRGSYKYLGAFYKENNDTFSCDNNGLININDIMDCYLILELKKTYERLNDKKNKDFNSSLKIYLGYLSALARQMHKDKITSITYSPQQKNNYTIFFIDEFNKEIHKKKKNKQFEDFQFGFKGVEELLNPCSNKNDKTTTFSLNKQMISHLISVNPKALLEKRTKLIADFIETNYPLPDTFQVQNNMGMN